MQYCRIDETQNQFEINNKASLILRIFAREIREKTRKIKEGILRISSFFRLFRAFRGQVLTKASSF
jgi:hypothetical protein